MSHALNVSCGVCAILHPQTLDCGIIALVSTFAGQSGGAFSSPGDKSTNHVKSPDAAIGQLP